MLECLKKTKWLRFFTRTYKDKNGIERKWDFCSRKDNPDLHTIKADAVCVVPFLSDGRIVVIKQFRPVLEKYVIETVAGLHDQPNALSTAMKELKEETGLNLASARVFDTKLYNSIGISDESCSYVFSGAYGNTSKQYLEDAEDIEVLILDRDEAKHILTLDLNFSAKCWLILQAYANGFDWMSIR